MKRFLPLAIALAISACSSSGPSEVCQNDGECEKELSCLPLTQADGDTCEVFADVCTQTCFSDPDCEELGEEFRCISQCDGSQICSATEAKTTNLPASAVCNETPECAGALLCLPVPAFIGDECMEVGMTCTMQCNEDVDCAELGDRFRCFEGCNGASVCGSTG